MHPSLPPRTPLHALVGCRTTAERNARGQGLVLMRANPQTGGQLDASWALVNTLPLNNPSFQVVNRAGTHAYSVHGDGEEVSVIALHLQRGSLALLQQCPTGGRNPVHLCLSFDERHLLVANYATGSLACFDVQPDGLLGVQTALLHFTGTPGPRSHDQKGSHPHQVVHWPGSDYYLVPDKGLDRVHVLRLATDGTLAIVSSFLAPAGAGPRHLALSIGTGSAHARSCAWLVHELSSEVARVDFDAASGQLSAGPVASVLPLSFAGANSAAGIALHPRGRTLYVSNRGHDSVCVFTLDAGQAADSARAVQWLHTGGRTPRFLCLTSDARALIVANENSDTLVRFSLDKQGLPITPAAQVLARTGSPVCVALAG